MGEHILFPAFCSATKKSFIVSGEYTRGVVTWHRGIFKDKLPASSMSGGAPEQRNVTSHDLSKFTCPGCGFRWTGATAFSFWDCSTCKALHCFGSANGKHHGACGNCVHDTDSFKPGICTPLAANGDRRLGDY